MTLFLLLDMKVISVCVFTLFREDVLLSEYLGNNTTPSTGAPSLTIALPTLGVRAERPNDTV